MDIAFIYFSTIIPNITKCMANYTNLASIFNISQINRYDLK